MDDETKIKFNKLNCLQTTKQNTKKNTVYIIKIHHKIQKKFTKIQPQNKT